MEESKPEIVVKESDLEKVAEEEDKEIQFPKDFQVCSMDQEIVWKAKQALFDTRIDDCEAMVREYVNNPWGMALYAEAAMWRFIFERRPEDFETATMRMRTSAAQAEVLIKRHKTKTDKKTLKTPEKGEQARLYLEAMALQGQSILFLGMLFMMQKSFIKGAFFLRKSWKCWELTNKTMLEMDDTPYPATRPVQGLVCFNVGFMNFFVSLVPSELMFIVKLLGFAGDREKAHQLLLRAHEIHDSGKSTESNLVLFVLYYWFMDEKENAPKVLDRLKAILPNSPIVDLALGWAALVTEHNTEKAIECYARAETVTSLPQLKLACKAQLAYAYYLREDWDKVLEILPSYMEKTSSVEAKCFSCFALGLAHYMRDRNAECTEWMKRCVEFEDKSSNWDVFCANVARSYLVGNKFDRCVLLFLLTENAVEAGFADRALEHCSELDKCTWEGFSVDDRNALIYYYRGCALRLQKQVDQAKSWLIKAAGMHQKNLALEARRAVPYSLVVLGEISMRELGQLEGAQRFFQKAKAYDKKYLFMETLSFRLKSNEEVLAAKMKKAPKE